jgi:hypothetical protein
VIRPNYIKHLGLAALVVAAYLLKYIFVRHILAHLQFSWSCCHPVYSFGNIAVALLGLYDISVLASAVSGFAESTQRGERKAHDDDVIVGKTSKFTLDDVRNKMSVGLARLGEPTLPITHHLSVCHSVVMGLAPRLPALPTTPPRVLKW